MELFRTSFNDDELNHSAWGTDLNPPNSSIFRSHPSGINDFSKLSDMLKDEQTSSPIELARNLNTRIDSLPETLNSRQSEVKNAERETLLQPYLLLGSAAGILTSLAPIKFDQAVLAVPPGQRQGLAKLWESRSPILQKQLQLIHRVKIAEENYAAKLAHKTIFSEAPNLGACKNTFRELVDGVYEANNLLYGERRKLFELGNYKPDYRTPILKGAATGFCTSIAAIATGTICDALLSSAFKYDIKRSNLKLLFDGVITPTIILSPLPGWQKAAGIGVSIGSARVAAKNGW